MAGRYKVTTSVDVESTSPDDAVLRAARLIAEQADKSLTYKVKRIDVPGRTLIIEVVDAQGQQR